MGRPDELRRLYFWPSDIEAGTAGLTARLTPTMVPLAYDAALIPWLLRKAENILRAGEMPKPRADWIDCVRTAHFLQLFGVETRQDHKVLADVQVVVP